MNKLFKNEKENCSRKIAHIVFKSLWMNANEFWKICARYFNHFFFSSHLKKKTMEFHCKLSHLALFFQLKRKNESMTALNLIIVRNLEFLFDKQKKKNCYGR